MVNRILPHAHPTVDPVDPIALPGGTSQITECIIEIDLRRS